MAYIFYNDLLNYTDQQNLNMASQDFGVPDQGAIPNMTLINSICQIASDQADSLVCSIYSVPFVNTPPKIRMAAIYFALYAIWARRRIPDEKNQWKKDADYWRETLIKVGCGEIPLDANQRRAFTPIVAQTYQSPINTNIY
jgi:phage gp36-like protein